MEDPRERGVTLSDNNSAKYTAIIDIEEPTYIEVSAEGPVSESLAKNSATVTQWLIPGKHINEGDALMLEIPGLLVKVLAETTHDMQRLLVGDAQTAANVRPATPEQPFNGGLLVGRDPRDS